MKLLSVSQKEVGDKRASNHHAAIGTTQDETGQRLAADGEIQIRAVPER